MIDIGQLLQAWALVIGWLIVLSVMAFVADYRGRKELERDQ